MIRRQTTSASVRADRNDLDYPASEPDEAGIVESAMNRDPDALATLYDIVYPPLFRLLSFSTRDRSHADDIADAVIPKVLASIPSVRDDAPSLRAWMMSTAWTLIERNYKEALPSVGYHLPPHFLDEGTSHTVEYTESADALSAAIRQLPASWQNYVVLRFIAGLARAEVAYVLGKPVSEMESIERDALGELGYWLQAFSE
jgi:RNA polymerase sigma factor (sigma-70 family)